MNPQKPFPVILLVVMFIASACNLQGSPTTPAAIAPNVSPVQPSVPSPSAAPVLGSPLSLTQFYQAHLDAGIWTDGQGLVDLLGLFTGSATEQVVIGNDNVSDFELTGLMQLADQYLAANPSGPLHDNLQKQINLLVAPTDQLPRFSHKVSLSPPGSPVQANLRLPSRPAATTHDTPECQTLWANGFSSPTPVICFEYAQRLVAGTNIYLYYPSWWTADEPKRAYLASLMEGADKAVRIYNSYGPNPIPPVTMVVTELPYLNPTTSLRNSRMLAFARSEAIPSLDCYIAFFPSLFAKTQEQASQAAAHEMFHCYEFKNLPRQTTGPLRSANEWWVEGAAEYFSNVVYPATNFEYEYLPELPDLMRSLMSLFSWSYKAFIFFQYLENRPDMGTHGILQLLGAMPTSGDRPYQMAALSAFPNMGVIFHEFALAIADQTIMDTDGSAIRFEVPTQVDTSYGSDPSAFNAAPFTVTIWPVTFARGFDFTLTPTVTGFGLSDARPALIPGLWGPLPSRVSTSCAEAHDLFVLTQTGATDAAEYDIQLAASTHPAANVCDTCLLGSWQLDNSSYLTHLNTLISQIAPDLVYTGITGTAFVKFTPDMVATQDIQDLSISADMDIAGAGTQFFTFIMSGTSDAAYLLAQNRITYNSITADITVTTTLNGQVMSVPTSTDYMSGGPLGTGATYTCSGNMLSMNPIYPDPPSPAPPYHDLPALLFTREP